MSVAHLSKRLRSLGSFRCLPTLPSRRSIQTCSNRSEYLGKSNESTETSINEVSKLDDQENAFKTLNVQDIAIDGIGSFVNVQHALLASQELRIECGISSELWIQLDEGDAEIFGAELQRGVPVNVAGSNVAVFTWTGCMIRVQGKRPRSMHVAGNTTMLAYRQAHEALNSKRQAALDSGSNGPHCIFLGPTDCGKSTLSKMFSNWAARDGWEPTFVDLDIGQGSITVPGCIAAAPVKLVKIPVPLEPESKVEEPLVYFFGHTSPADNPEVYKFLVEQLASTLRSRAEMSPKAAAAGLIINTMGWIDGLGYQLQLHAIASLKVDVVLVLEQARLFDKISKKFEVHPGISVIKLDKSMGVVVRGKKARMKAREQRVHDYFYGSTYKSIPITRHTNLDYFSFFHLGDVPRSLPGKVRPMGARTSTDPRVSNRGYPMGARVSIGPLRTTELAPNAEMVHSLMSVSNAVDEHDVASSDSAGFILFKEVDVAGGSAQCLTCMGSPHGRFLVTGSIKSDTV